MRLIPFERSMGCVGRDYAKLDMLWVYPSFQNQGIGTKILLDGLERIDKLHLQYALTVSENGMKLYKKHDSKLKT
ncbi:hypothetical protein BDZ45DRAFT_418180 [Acephala macrosclerotiorum]|nr:hypothetical protein BDZ45DRAFT_418180 [Acephala macrosclerotiorum]